MTTSASVIGKRIRNKAQAAFMFWSSPEGPGRGQGQGWREGQGDGQLKRGEELREGGRACMSSSLIFLTLSSASVNHP